MYCRYCLGRGKKVRGVVLQLLLREREKGIYLLSSSHREIGRRPMGDWSLMGKHVGTTGMQWFLVGWVLNVNTRQLFGFSPLGLSFYFDWMASMQWDCPSPAVLCLVSSIGLYCSAQINWNQYHFCQFIFCVPSFTLLFTGVLCNNV